MVRAVGRVDAVAEETDEGESEEESEDEVDRKTVETVGRFDV
jgi:hypothetical protein